MARKSNILLSILLMIATIFTNNSSYGQTPMYAKNGGASRSNVQGFGGSARIVQLLYKSSDISPSIPNNTSIDTLFFMYGDQGNAETTTLTNFTVKIGYTTDLKFNNTSFYTSLSTVFNASTYTINPGASSSWFYIPLSTPFLYDSTKTLIVELTNTATAATGSSLGTSVYCGLVVDSQKLSTNTAGALTGSLNSFLPNIGFNVAKCFAPTNLDVNFASNIPTFSWTQSGSPSSWQLKYGPSGFDVTNSGTLINTAVNSYTAASPLNSTSNYDFYVRAICGAGDTSEWSSIYRFITPCMPVSNPTGISGKRCGPGRVQLVATNIATYANWYADSLATSPIGYGDTFTTPNITQSTKYYVSTSNTLSSRIDSLGIVTLDVTKVNSFGLSPSFGLSFDVYTPINLSSVTLFPYSSSNASGTVTIGLYDSVDNLLQKATFHVVGSDQNLNSLSPYIAQLNFNIPVGNNYKLGLVEFTGISGLMSHSSTNSTVQFPYRIQNVVQIESSISSNVVNYDVYYYFYHWKLGEYNCESQRVPVWAMVNPFPISTLPNDTAICLSASSITLTAGDTINSYIWSLNNDTSNAITVADTGSYKVLITSPDSCSISDSIKVSYQPETSVDDFIATNLFNEEVGKMSFSAVNAVNAINYSWNFGDGSPISMVSNPTHTYTVLQEYEVTLIVSSPCGSDTVKKKINVNDPSSIADIDLDSQLKIYPVPAKDYLLIETANNNIVITGVEIYNILGIKLYQNSQVQKNYDIDVYNFASGLYTIRIYTNEGDIVRKVQIMK